MWSCSSFTLLIKYRTGWLKDISGGQGTRRWYISASTTNHKRKLGAAFFYSLQLSLGRQAATFHPKQLSPVFSHFPVHPRKSECFKNANSLQHL